jgi:hypothetical protein
VRGDSDPEPSEGFAVLLNDAVNAALAEPIGMATITDDDPSATWSVSSADGRTTIGVASYIDGRLSWHVTRDTLTVLADSPLGIIRADQAFTDHLRFVEASTTSVIEERYRTPAGKRREHAFTAREMTLTFETTAGARLGRRSWIPRRGCVATHRDWRRRRGTQLRCRYTSRVRRRPA